MGADRALDRAVVVGRGLKARLRRREQCDDPFPIARRIAPGATRAEFDAAFTAAVGGALGAASASQGSGVADDTLVPLLSDTDAAIRLHAAVALAE